MMNGMAGAGEEKVDEPERADSRACHRPVSSPCTTCGGLGVLELEHIVPGDPITGRCHGIGGRRVCLGSFGGSTRALVYGVRRRDAEAGTARCVFAHDTRTERTPSLVDEMQVVRLEIDPSASGRQTAMAFTRQGRYVPRREAHGRGVDDADSSGDEEPGANERRLPSGLGRELSRLGSAPIERGVRSRSGQRRRRVSQPVLAAGRSSGSYCSATPAPMFSSMSDIIS